MDSLVDILVKHLRKDRGWPERVAREHVARLVEVLNGAGFSVSKGRESG